MKTFLCLSSVVANGKASLAKLFTSASPLSCLARALHSGQGLEHAEKRAHDWLDRFKNFERVGVPRDAGSANSKVFSLDRMHLLLEHMGSPHTLIPNVIHVVGTKGKGSVTSLLVSMLHESGERVGSYGSPHVLSFYERITVPGRRNITAEEFVRLVEQCKPAVDAAQREAGGKLTYFEVLTALAFKHLASCETRWAVIEAGMGGVSDATNVFDATQVRACVVTAVEREHMEALGGSLEAIARAKAGIFKPRGVAVVGRQPLPEAERIVLEVAASRGCSVIRADSVHVHSSGLGPAGSHVVEQLQIVCPREGLLCRAKARLVGQHQRDNVATAVATIRALNGSGALSVSNDAIASGISAASLPGRFQASRVAIGDGGGWLVLDCAHTALSMAALRCTLEQVFPRSPRVVALALAVDKDARSIAAEVLRMQPALVLCTSCDIAGSRARSLPPADLAAAVRKAAAEDVQTGLRDHGSHGKAEPMTAADGSEATSDFGAVGSAELTQDVISHAIFDEKNSVVVAVHDDMESAMRAAADYLGYLGPTVTRPGLAGLQSSEDEVQSGFGCGAAPVICITGSNYAVKSACLIAAEILPPL